MKYFLLLRKRNKVELTGSRWQGKWMYKDANQSPYPQDGTIFQDLTARPMHSEAKMCPTQARWIPHTEPSQYTAASSARGPAPGSDSGNSSNIKFATGQTLVHRRGMASRESNSSIT